MIKKRVQKDFEYFKERCQHWISFFGLSDWEIYYHFGDLESGNAAQCAKNAMGKIATMSLSDRTDTRLYLAKHSRKEIDRSAFHEVVHLLLGDYCALAKARFVIEDEIVMAEEAVIRRLENSVWDLLTKEEK